MSLALPGEKIYGRNLSNGSWVEGSGSSIEVKSPYFDQVIGTVPKTTDQEINSIIGNAAQAFDSWKQTPLKERTQLLFRLRELILRDIDEISTMAALECGKTFAEAKAGVFKGLEVAEFALSQQNFDYGGSMEVSRGVTCSYRREPMGVVAAITPFNFPCMVPMWMLPIAMTAGNCVVLKPSEKVPLTSQILGRLVIEAGYPAGVFSIVNGDRQAVESILDHQEIKAVGFVGSTAAAKSVYARATANGKRCLALGGAKNHLILTPDANESVTIKGIVDSFTGCAGQRCMAASLMVAVGPVDQLIEKIVAHAATLKLGDQMGAIIDKPSLDRINGILERAEKDGVKILLDGRKTPAPAGYAHGYWLGPTIIEATPDKECATTEIFGPVLTIVRAQNITDAMKLENSSHYGNACSVFTSSGEIAETVAQLASSGMVGVNIGVPVPREPFSFGGTKDSRFGNGDITGADGLDFWTSKKKITVKWAHQSDQNWMS